MASGASEQAEQMFKKALKVDPLYSPAHDNLAKHYLRQNSKDSAVGNLRKTISAHPQEVGTYLTLARILEIKGDFSQAITVYRRALEQDPSLWVVQTTWRF